MFQPHTAIFRCYSILSRSWCSVMPIFAYVMLPAMCFSWWCSYCQCPFVRIFVLSLWPPCCLFFPLGRFRYRLSVSLQNSHCPTVIQISKQYWPQRVKETYTSYHKGYNSMASVRKELYRRIDRCLSVKLVPTFCQVLSVTNSCGRILGFLDRSRYYCFQVAPQLHSRGWVDQVPEQFLL
jgi:hypothetical protein